MEFEKSPKFPGAQSDLTLLGSGVREKKIAFVPVRVYAVAFYVNEEQLTKDLESFSKDVAGGAFDKGLQIRLLRDIDGDTFSSALDKELKPRIKDAHATEVLAEFMKVFKDRLLKKGTAVYFTWTQPETLHVYVSEDGSPVQEEPSEEGSTKPVSVFSSGVLAAALFDVYLGQSPVAPSLKSSVEESVGLKLASLQTN